MTATFVLICSLCVAVVYGQGCAAPPTVANYVFDCTPKGGSLLDSCTVRCCFSCIATPTGATVTPSTITCSGGAWSATSFTGCGTTCKGNFAVAGYTADPAGTQTSTGPTATCTSGYAFATGAPPSGTASCSAPLTWTGTFSGCKRMCPTLDYIGYDITGSCASSSYTGTLCNLGTCSSFAVAQAGSSSVQCAGNYLYSGSANNCLTTCPALTMPGYKINPYCASAGVPYGTQCTATCDVAAFFTGVASGYMKCSSPRTAATTPGDGYSGAFAGCNPVCPPLTTLPAGYDSPCAMNYAAAGTQCQITCARGYSGNPQGHYTAKCPVMTTAALWTGVYTETPAAGDTSNLRGCVPNCGTFNITGYVSDNCKHTPPYFSTSPTTVCNLQCAAGYSGSPQGYVYCSETTGQFVISVQPSGCERQCDSEFLQIDPYSGNPAYYAPSCGRGTNQGTLCSDVQCAPGYSGTATRVTSTAMCGGGSGLSAYVAAGGFAAYTGCVGNTCSAYSQRGYDSSPNCGDGTEDLSVCIAPISRGKCTLGPEVGWTSTTGAITGSVMCVAGKYVGKWGGCTPLACSVTTTGANATWTQEGYTNFRRCNGNGVGVDDYMCADCAAGYVGTVSGTVYCAGTYHAGSFSGCSLPGTAKVWSTAEIAGLAAGLGIGGAGMGGAMAVLGNKMGKKDDKKKDDKKKDDKKDEENAMEMNQVYYGPEPLPYYGPDPAPAAYSYPPGDQEFI